MRSNATSADDNAWRAVRIDDIDVSVLQRTSGNLVPDQERIVGPWRVDDRGRKAELAAAEIEIGRLDDIGVDAFVLRAGAGEAGADISFEDIQRQ